MSTETASSNLTARPLEHLQVILNPYGTLNCGRFIFPDISATPDPTPPARPVLSKDVPINPSHSTWARIFLPHHHARSCSEEKLPLEYIPRHRLPMVYDDAVEALHWVKTGPDKWLANHADLSMCYLMGTNAGGNVAFHGGLRASALHEDLKPLVNNQTLPLAARDFMWELSLPIGVNRDHEYCNPVVDGGSKLSEGVDKMKLLGWRLLVTGCNGDPLIDRQGVSVVSDFAEGGFDGIDLLEPDKSKLLVQTLKISCRRRSHVRS
ncbi:hypothetical protein ACJRO7_002835 [Eucalyptus globulus]|uniref:Alpha/beta hydrolase fold-3 domain-containing protein n=1 Tax=Eucalyptus globulus TaxID=34317 RepID=A0ABD3LZC1_EUCGL